MESNINVIRLGASRKKLASDLTVKNQIIKMRRWTYFPWDVVIKSYFKCCRLLKKFKGRKILFVSTRSTFLNEQLDKIALKKSNLHYFSYKWVAGFLTNNRVVKKNFDISNNFKSQTKLRIFNRIYRGIKNLRGLPDLIIVFDDNSGNVAIEEALKLKIPVIALRDTDSRLSDKVEPLFMNSSDSRIKSYLISSFSRLI